MMRRPGNPSSLLRAVALLALAAAGGVAEEAPCGADGGFMSEIRCAVPELQPVDTLMERISSVNDTTEAILAQMRRSDAAYGELNASSATLRARVDKLDSTEVANILAVYDKINRTSAELNDAIFERLQPEVDALRPALASLNATVGALEARADATDATLATEGVAGLRALVTAMSAKQATLETTLSTLQATVTAGLEGLGARLGALESVAYTLHVNTTTDAVRAGSSTLNSVYYTWYSATDATRERTLSSLGFAAGSTRSFEMELPATFGEITGLRLRIGNLYPGDGWGLGGVTLTRGTQTITFSKPNLYEGLLKVTDAGASFVGNSGFLLTSFASEVTLTPRNTLTGQLGQLQGMVRALAGQLTLAQTQAEQRARSLGGSGLSKVRSYGTGSQPYHEATHNNFGSANVHDHSQNIRTVGLGEFSAVLNGVEFTTRHNDYALKRPHRTGGGYHEVENIEFPAVPPAVLAAGSPTDRMCVDGRIATQVTSDPNITMHGLYKGCDRTIGDGWCDLHHEKMGTYVFDPYSGPHGCSFQTCGGRPVYKLEGGFSAQRNTSYLYYINDNNCPTRTNCDTHPGKWIVGPVVGSVSGWMFWTDTTGTKAPTPLSIPTTGSNAERMWTVFDANAPDPAQPWVPAAVKCSCDNRAYITAQVAEMREWFRAWQTNNITHRDYRPYFRPQLCYMEGAWISDTEDIEEPFFSDRHHIDAKTWEELHAKVRFLLNNGRKSNLENLPFLPTTVHDVKDGMPVIANWEYRIMCHSIVGELPLDRFRVVRDMATQLATAPPLTLEQLAATRRARFVLNPENSSTWAEGPTTWEFLDALMEQIPGKDNYAADLRDESFGFTTLHYNSAWRENATEGDITVGLVREFAHADKLNTGYYSRYYQTAQTDASGRQRRKRGFNDGHLFAAMTTQPKVSGLTVDDGTGPVDPGCTAPGSIGCPRTPSPVKQRWTWAIPIEIVYLTPLTNWNPFGLTFRGKALSPQGKLVSQGGRNGAHTPHGAFDGSNEKVFYRTPTEFFNGESGRGDKRDPADTEKGAVGVLDPSGQLHTARGSGTWIMLPHINGVGDVRTRYPIFPIHHDGNTAYKELKALEALTLNGDTVISESVRQEAQGVTLQLTWANNHVHTITLRAVDIDKLARGEQVTKDSTEDNGHSHRVVLNRGSASTYNIVSMSNPEPHQLAVLTSPV